MVCGICVLGRRLLQQEGGGEPPPEPGSPGVGDRAPLALEGGRRGLRSRESQPLALSVLWNSRPLGSAGRGDGGLGAGADMWKDCGIVLE